MPQIYGYNCKQQNDLIRFCKLLALFHSFLLNLGILKKNVKFHDMLEVNAVKYLRNDKIHFNAAVTFHNK